MSMDFSPINEFVGRNWLFTLMFGAICFLTKIIFDLHREKASLEAKISSLAERNVEIKSGSKDEIAKLKVENLEFQKTIQEKCSDEAILAKYEFNDVGVPIHRVTKKPYCPACLQDSSRKEVLLTDSGPADDYLRCPVGQAHHHIFEKVQSRGSKQIYYGGVDDE